MNKGVTIASGIGALGLGAGLMYLLDPDRGNRRRALIRDQAVHLAHKTSDALGTAATDISNRVRGLVAETQARFRHEEVPDDLLVERVRAKMGHAVSHPRAITVTAHQGRVTLSGRILAQEAGRLLAAAAAVRGVTGVENQSRYTRWLIACRGCRPESRAG
jgi:osmotically-inducible protein OsmY